MTNIGTEEEIAYRKICNVNLHRHYRLGDTEVAYWGGKRIGLWHQLAGRTYLNSRHLDKGEMSGIDELLLMERVRKVLALKLVDVKLEPSGVGSDEFAIRIDGEVVGEGSRKYRRWHYRFRDGFSDFYPEGDSDDVRLSIACNWLDGLNIAPRAS